jgi:hypothetical protein
MVPTWKICRGSILLLALPCITFAEGYLAEDVQDGLEPQEDLGTTACIVR